MAGRGVARPVWVKQAEEARLKEEEQKAAAAKAAFEATFKSHDTNNNNNNNNEGAREEEEEAEEEEEEQEEAAKPIGPVDPAKCTAAGTGVGGGAAGTVASFVVTTRDSEGRRIPHGGHSVKVRIRSAGGGAEQEALIKDHGDGSYTATYAVAKRGDYTVVVDCNGQPISGSPFPVFFSGGGSVVPATTGGAAVGFVNGVSAQQSFPNMAMSGMVGMMPGILPGANGGLVLPALGEVCREYLSGRCVKSDCKLGHPPHNQLMVALSAGSSMGMGMGMGMGTSMGMGMGMGMGVLSQMPMGPSAAAMAAAQTIVAAQALQAHVQSAGEAAGLKSQGDSSTASKETDKLVVLSRTVQVSNISPLLTTDPLRRLFSYCGTVIDFRMVDSEQMLYVQYAKPEEARAALSLNNMEVGGKPLSVEMAKSVPQSMVTTVFNASSSTGQTPPLPMMMQQAVAMQQLQFQQALMMQQAMASQQAASRAATVKSAAEAAAMRAAEISKTLKGDSDNKEEKELTPARKSRSRSRSRSPVRYHHSRRGRSRSLSPIRYRRDNRQRSRSRDRHRHRSRSRDRSNHYRDSRDNYRGYHAIREQERERDRYSRILSRSRSRSPSRSRTRRSPRAFSRSPKYRKESHISREVKREDHRSARHRRRSKSITRDQREGNVENGLQRFPAERRHEIKGGDSLKRDASDVKEDKSKKKTSCEVRREDNKPLRHSRRSKSISKDSREGSFEKESSISPAERRYTYNEVKMEENKSACHFKRSKSVSKDSREDNLENDLSVTPADRKNMLRGGMEEASHSRHSKLISKDLIEHNLEKDLTFSPSKRTGKDEGKGEDYEPAPYYRHSKSTLKDARQASLENLNISSAEVRDTSHELKREDRKSSRHSRCSESKSKDSMEVDLEEELSISLAGGRDKLQQLKGEDCKSARYSKHSESRSEDLREGSFDKDLRFSPSKSRAQKRDKLGEGGTIGTCTVDVKQVEDKVRQHMSVNPIEYLKQSEVEEAAVERSDHEEIWEDECHEVVSKQELIRRETKITEDALVDDSIQENRKVRKDSRTGQKTDAREINEKTNYVREEYGETVDGGDRCKEKKSHSNAMNVGDEVKLTETTRQDNEIEAVDEVDEIEENLLNKNEDKLNDAKEEGTKQKRRHKREKEGDDKKKRKRHKNRHRKEDDGEKTEKRRKKHKHHRSTSISTEISPLDDSERSDKKKKKHKRRRHASYSPESSPSVDVDKYDNSGKNGVSQHKQKHRDGSNSMYRSQSLQV